MTSAPTTIKVSRTTRDRLMVRARLTHSTAEQALSALLDDAEWRDRMSRVKADMQAVDSAYRDESALWDTAAPDGLR